MIKKDCLRASSYRSEYYHIVIVLLVLVVEADLGEKDRSKGNFRLRV